MKKIVVLLISFYQKYLSLDTGFLRKWGLTRKNICVFYPTCSEYTKIAVLKYGTARGLLMGVIRITRCHPWQKNHFDPVP